MLTNFQKFVSKNNFLKKSQVLDFFQKMGKKITTLKKYHIFEILVQKKKHKVSSTNLKFSQYLWKYKINVNPMGYIMG